jgi:hypothetical protein
VTGATIARTGPGHRAAFRASTFADVLRSEWVKLRSVRSTFWALTTTVVLGIALGAVISAVTAHAYARFSVAAKLSWDPTGVSQAGVAIACMIAVLFVLPGIAQALPDSWRNPVTEFWPTQAGSQLTSVYHSAHTLQPWPGFGVMCLFVAIVYAIAWTLLDHRDA